MAEVRESALMMIWDESVFDYWRLSKPVIMGIKKNFFWAREACALPIILEKSAMVGSWEDHHAKVSQNWQVPSANISATRP